MRGYLHQLSSPQHFNIDSKKPLETNRAALYGAECSTVLNPGTSDGQGGVSSVMIERMKVVPGASYAEGDEYND